MSFWDKTKGAAKSGATATKEGATKLKLKADISIKKGNIKKLKKEFGIKLYDVMVTHRYAASGETAFAEVRAAVHDIEAIIIGKENQILELDPNYVRTINRKEHASWSPNIHHDPSQRRAKKKFNPSTPPPETKSSRPFKAPPPVSNSQATFAPPQSKPPTRYNSNDQYCLVSHEWNQGYKVKEIPKGQNPDTVIRRESITHSSVMFKSIDGGNNWLVHKQKGTGKIDDIIRERHKLLPKPTDEPPRYSSNDPVVSAFAPPQRSDETKQQQLSHPTRAKVGRSRKRSQKHKFVAKPPNNNKNVNGGYSKPKNSLLQWCQNSTEGFNGVRVRNFTSSWVNGLAFAALVANFRPDCLDFSKLHPKKNPLGTAKAAFAAAEKAGITILLDAEDLAVKDKKSNMTQLSMFYKGFGSSSPNPKGKAKWNNKFNP